MEKEGGENSGDQSMRRRIAGNEKIRVGEGGPAEHMRQRKEAQGGRGL